jgi:CheY-like chemotaxis protein
MNDRKRLLIVDDDTDVLLFLEDRLNTMGYDVLVATNGQEGLEVLQDQSVSGVILDVEMPVMGGMAMLKKLGAIFSPPPVILMSANAHLSELQDVITKGAQDVLFKPITQEELVRKCLQHFH